MLVHVVKILDGLIILGPKVAKNLPDLGLWHKCGGASRTLPRVRVRCGIVLIATALPHAGWAHGPSRQKIIEDDALWSRPLAASRLREQRS